MLPCPRILAAGFGLAALLVSTSAAADQIVVFDQTYVHAPDLPDSHFRMPPGAGTPENWVSPIDWSQGSAWVHLEVTSKPTDQETKFQVCFEATPTYGCTYQSPTYTEVGVYEWETPFDAFWSPPGTAVDWTQGVNQIACILKDTRNGKPSADNVGDEIAALYMPTDVRIVVTLVEEGSVYEPPEPLDAGTGTSGGSEGGEDTTGADDGGAEATGPATSSSGADTTAAADDAAPSEDDGPPPASDDGATSTSDATGTDGGAQDSDDTGGCGCTSGRDRWGTVWLALGLLALARGRVSRRR
jgi:hypothetical protein